MEFASALAAIIVIDLVLAGDNAIVIALAARNVPRHLQRRAVIWGTVGAIVVRSSLTLIVVWPFVYNLWLSVTNLGLYTIKDGPSFVGLAQYVRLFGEPELYTYLLRTLIWTGINVVFHVVIGVGLALLLNRPFQGRAFSS